MQWWENYDQALGLADAIRGTEEPSLLAGSAALMLHAAGRRTLDTEAAAVSATRHGLSAALGRIVQDRLAGCVSKSLSDIAGKPFYGPFRAAAMKTEADNGATALIDALVAAKVPYRDAVAASARSYGIAKRDGLILARVIKSDPDSLSSHAASQRALLLWAQRVANAEAMALVSKGTDEFWVETASGRKKRTVNRDKKGQFATKGAADEAAPKLTTQQAYDLKLEQQRQRMRERARQKRGGIRIGIAQGQAQAQEQVQRQMKQPPKQQSAAEQARIAEQERLARIEQTEREELAELQELRDLRRMRRGRRQRREANQARERAAQIESGYQMISEANRRQIDVVANRARLGKLMDELKAGRQAKAEKKQMADEYSKIAAENVTSLLNDITDRSKGETFDIEDPSKTSYRQEVKFLNVPMDEKVVLHVPMMFKPDGDMKMLDYPDEDDVFFMYTGKRLPQGKNIEDLEPEDDGFVDFVFTAGFVNRLHSGALQTGAKHPLEELSRAFDERAGYEHGTFLNAVMEQIAADQSRNTWHQIEDANGTPYRAMAQQGQVAVIRDDMPLDEYLSRYRPNMTEEDEFIYQDPHIYQLDAERAERDMEEVMTDIDPQLARAAIRGYAIYQMTRESQKWASNYHDYQFKFPSAFVGFDVDTAKTSPAVMHWLREKNDADGMDYGAISRSDETVYQDTEDELKIAGIDPSDVIGMVSAIPAVTMLGEWEDEMVDIQRGFYNRADNYAGRSTEKGQNWYRNYRIAGVQPLWSVGLHRKAKDAKSDVEQAEMLARMYSDGPDRLLSGANTAITDLEEDTDNSNRKYTDQKYVQSLLNLLQVMAVSDTIRNMPD